MQYADICNKKQEIVSFLKESDNFEVYKKFVNITKIDSRAKNIRHLAVDLYQPEEVFCRDIDTVLKMEECIKVFDMIRTTVELYKIVEASDDLVKQANDLAFRAENIVLNMKGIKIDVGIDWNKYLS